MFTFIRFFILFTLCLSAYPASAQIRAYSAPNPSTSNYRDCTAYMTYPVALRRTPLRYYGNCPSGRTEGQQSFRATLNGQEYTVFGSFENGLSVGVMIYNNLLGYTFSGFIGADGSGTGRLTYPDGTLEVGSFQTSGLWTGTRSSGNGQSGTERYENGQVGTQTAQRGQLSNAIVTQATPVPSQSVTRSTTATRPKPTTRAVTRTSPPNLNCTAYIAYPLEFEGIGLQYRGNCPDGYAEGQQEIVAYASGKEIKVNSTFRSGGATGQTNIYIKDGLTFSGVVLPNGNVEGLVTFPDGRIEMGTFTSGRLTDGVLQASNSKRYYRGGREVSERVYETGTQNAQSTSERPSYAYNPSPAPVAALAPPPRQSPQRRRRGDECTIDRPTQWYTVQGSYEGECEGGRFTGTATLELNPLEQGDPRVKLKVPYRRGVISGQVVAEYPQMNSVFRGTITDWEPQDGQMLRNLGNRNYLITDYRDGRAVSSRQEYRPPSELELLLYNYLGAVVDQQMNKLIDDTFNGPERRRERRRIQADQTTQREAFQAEERQRVENIRLANEANARQVAEREAARVQAENDRQTREAARVVQQADADRRYAEQQVASQREYDARQAEANERERQRQGAEQEAEAARQRQMAQNTISVGTNTPVFGGSTNPPVVTTNPPEGVPPPTVGTNPPRNEVPPPVDLTPTIRPPDVPPLLQSGTDLTSTREQPDVPPPLQSGTQPDLRPTFNEPTPVPPPNTVPTPLPSGQDLRPSFPSQPDTVQPPTRNDTLGSGSTNSQPTLTYSDVMTQSERELSARLPLSLRAESLYSPEQIRQIKQDGRWQNWVNEANAYLAPAPSQPTRQATIPSTSQVVARTPTPTATSQTTRPTANCDSGLTPTEQKTIYDYMAVTNTAFPTASIICSWKERGRMGIEMAAMGNEINRVRNEESSWVTFARTFVNGIVDSFTIVGTIREFDRATSPLDYAVASLGLIPGERSLKEGAVSYIRLAKSAVGRFKFAEARTALESAQRFISQIKRFRLTSDGPNYNNFRYAQTTMSETFSRTGPLSGQSVESVTEALRRNTISIDSLPIQYAVRDGVTIVLNTRSSQALLRAGVLPSRWKWINIAGDPAAEQRLIDQLANNNLPPTGYVGPIR